MARKVDQPIVFLLAEICPTVSSSNPTVHRGDFQNCLWKLLFVDGLEKAGLDVPVKSWTLPLLP